MQPFKAHCMGEPSLWSSISRVPVTRAGDASRETLFPNQQREYLVPKGQAHLLAKHPSAGEIKYQKPFRQHRDVTTMTAITMKGKRSYFAL